MSRYGRTGILALSLALLISGCGVKNTEADTPEKVTETFLSYMKEGEYEKAAALTGTAFDADAQGEDSDLQLNAMKAMYANMEYELGEEEIKENTASVTVVIRNADYTDTMNNAVFETLKAKEDDAYTQEIFEALLKEAPKQETEVTVNYRKQDGVWKFDGGNSQLRAAMSGYGNGAE